MLRFTRVLKHRKVYGRAIYSVKASNTKETSSTQNVQFKDEGDLASVQERALFGAVFNKLMKREESRKKSGSEILSHATSIVPGENNDYNNDDSRGLQVVFEKKNQEIRPEDRKLFDFFKNTSGGSQLGDIGESAKLTTDDIRNYPVSLISSIFSEKDHKQMPGSEKASKILADDKVSALLDKVAGVESSLNLKMNKEVLETLEAKERFNAAINGAMEKYLADLHSEIETDYDFLALVKRFLNMYVNRDTILDNNDLKSSAEIVSHIRKQLSFNSKNLPQPYGVTLPFTLVKLLTSKELNFPSERKYALASYIYQECKNSNDISLYLNVCNVDFYNLLLQLSWDNFREVYQLKQLTTEMSINGIRGDIYTVEILGKIAHELRHINDGIVDEDTGIIEGNPLTVGVVWCRENSVDLLLLENYLKKLKESLA